MHQSSSFGHTGLTLFILLCLPLMPCLLQGASAREFQEAYHTELHKVSSGLSTSAAQVDPKYLKYEPPLSRHVHIDETIGTSQHCLVVAQSLCRTYFRFSPRLLHLLTILIIRCVMALHPWCRINRTALDKITKKFDKVRKAKLRGLNREVMYPTWSCTYAARVSKLHTLDCRVLAFEDRCA